jgi:thioredoxin 1
MASEHVLELNDATFDQAVASAPVLLVDFWAPWCGPCVAIAPSLEALAGEFQGKVTIAKMNVDENANTPAQFAVRSIPFLVLFKDGKAVDQVVGAVPKPRLAEMLNKHV